MNDKKIKLIKAFWQAGYDLIEASMDDLLQSESVTECLDDGYYFSLILNLNERNRIACYLQSEQSEPLMIFDRDISKPEIH